VTAPLVSVVIPAFNASRWIAGTVGSVLAQTWPSVETIVVDDGSTDGTADRLRPYLGRMALRRQENRGGGAARNAGAIEARGDFLLFLDHDDLLEPRALETQVGIALRHPEAAVVVSDGSAFSGDRVVATRLLRDPVASRADAAAPDAVLLDAHPLLLKGCPIASPGQALVRREAWKEHGPFPEEREVASDFALWLRIALRRPFAFHAARLLRYRVDEGSRSGPPEFRRLRWALMDLPVLRRHLAACPRGARRGVRSAIWRRAKRARLAWDFGRRHGMREARSMLARMARAAPWAPWPWLWWLRTWGPG
jgi:glycosyltransferase involved in cell wall biosynthesis